MVAGRQGSKTGEQDGKDKMDLGSGRRFFALLLGNAVGKRLSIQKDAKVRGYLRDDITENRGGFKVNCGVVLVREQATA